MFELDSIRKGGNMAITSRFREPVFALITVPVFILLYVFTFLIALITWPYAFFKFKKATQTILQFWAHGVFWIMGRRPRFSGLEHIDRKRKYILIANHTSMFDIPAIMAFYPGISFFGRERLLRIPLFGQILKMTDYIPMSKADIRNTKRMLNQLVQKSEGLSIAIFPEGTRTIDGNLNPFRRGFIHVLKNTELAILPVTISGCHNLKPKTRFSINFRSKVHITIHEPVENHLIRNKEDQEIIQQVRETIQSAYQHGS
jgi:1-acyl-sn-glycerol-3-phosphate acyltransferase